MEKRGQFFLIAAIIIITITLSITSLVNTVSVRDPNENFFDRSNEIRTESKKVIDYGVYYNNDTQELLRSFLNNYSSYIADDRALFIFGNQTAIDGLYFERDALAGSVGVGAGGLPLNDFVHEVRHGSATINWDQGRNIVHVTIEGVGYDFSLHEGENFYFVIIREEQGESYASSG